MYGIASDNGYIDVLPGIRIKTLNYGHSSLMTEFRLTHGAVLPEHAHPHEQTGYLVSGRMRLHIGDQARDLVPGDSWCIPSNVPHRAEIVEDSVALEVFAPCREDYIRYAHRPDIDEGGTV